MHATERSQETAGGLTLDVELVDRLLRERDWSWARLSRELDMAKSTISRVRRRRTRPGGKMILALQQVFPAHRDALFIRDPAA